VSQLALILREINKLAIFFARFSQPRFAENERKKQRAEVLSYNQGINIQKYHFREYFKQCKASLTVNT